ncbi:MAG TPA: methyltransferase domain-containing protein [Bryobacteraceae bacterium]|nr:methyltransferase domain-containing protein [Bryobacteraceae bacterium]
MQTGADAGISVKARREGARLAADLMGIGSTVPKALAFVYLPFVAVLTLIYFPYDTDRPDSAAAASVRRSYYEAAYKGSAPGRRGIDYEEAARASAASNDLIGKVRKFVHDHNLTGKRVLDVGSGHGLLQDAVDDYTGIDLSSRVASFYHKPFVAGSATAMPFADNSFDAVWTFWVLEHIPQPERALIEMRRVLKNGGLLLLSPAWDCTPWAADGFGVRPYEEFNWSGKLVKASLPLIASPFFSVWHAVPIRAIRSLQYRMGGETTRLRFRALNANYQTYWEPDADAAVSLTRYEAWLWFRARGDECLNCGDGGLISFDSSGIMVIRVRK